MVLGSNCSVNVSVQWPLCHWECTSLHFSLRLILTSGQQVIALCIYLQGLVHINQFQSTYTPNRVIIGSWDVYRAPKRKMGVVFKCT